MVSFKVFFMIRNSGKYKFFPSPFSFSPFSFFFLLISLASCEKDITIKLDPTTTDLVVDASIENGKYPDRRASKSLEYFSRLDPSLLTVILYS